MSVLVWTIKDPGRGVFDNEQSTSIPGWKETLKSLSKNKFYLTSVIGNILLVWSLGAMSDWLPAFLDRNMNIGVDKAGILAGVATVVGGIVGSLLGGYLPGKLKPFVKQSEFFVSFIGMVPSIILLFILIIIKIKNEILIGILLIITEIGIFLNSAPMSTVIANNVSFTMRTRAFGISLLFMHLFGDAFSPVIVGEISDVTGSLTFALIVVNIFFILSATAFASGWLFLKKPTHDLILEE